MRKEDMKKLAVGYIRVSTSKQEVEGTSLSQQAGQIRDHAIKKGFELAAVYEDVASAMPGRSITRPGFLDALRVAKDLGAVLLVTDVDRLTRSAAEARDVILTSAIPVHVVGLGRKVGRATLFRLAKEAEAEGLRIVQDTRHAIQAPNSKSKQPGASKKTLLKASSASNRQRAISSWQTVTDIATFISDDPVRRSLTTRELAAGLNLAGMKRKSGKMWTMETLRKPYQKAKEHLRLQEEPDDLSVGFDAVEFS